jgi:hypothetical protein
MSLDIRAMLGARADMFSIEGGNCWNAGDSIEFWLIGPTRAPVWP